MIDTVCLLIPKEKMRFLLGVSSWELYSKTDQYQKFVRNPSKMEKDTGKYFPRLTGYKRMYSQEANVRIEFSAPKLVYLNNLDELEDKDFPRVVETLQERLKDMGVILTKSVIEKAAVSSVHFSKNILLKDGYTVNHLISELNKIDLRKSFDFAKT
jgi:glutamate-1-semialdehyde aminotransferase